MNILAFDLGASGGKLFLAKIDGDNVSIENIHRFDNVSYSANGALFWDIINIYKEMNVFIFITYLFSCTKAIFLSFFLLYSAFIPRSIYTYAYFSSSNFFFSILACKRREQHECL